MPQLGFSVDRMFWNQAWRHRRESLLEAQWWGIVQGRAGASLSVARLDQGFGFPVLLLGFQIWTLESSEIHGNDDLI